MSDSTLLSGKAVVVTGAGSGLGRGYAEYLAARGAQVIVNDIDAQRADAVVKRIAAAGGTSVACVGSITEFDFANSLVAACVKEFGRIDGLVNNAGIYYHVDPWDDRPERYGPVIEINVLGTMHCGIALMNHLRGIGQAGAIVNIVSGAQCGLPEMAVYSASKGAVASLTYTWASDCKSSNIRVNAVSPIGRSGTGDEADPKQGPNATKDPLHVAPLVAYLLSDYSKDVTGQVFRMNPPELAIMNHPGFFADSVRVDDWDAEGIHNVVDAELHKWFQPVGGVLCVTGETGRILGPGQEART